MARGINKVILVGNLGNDPDVKYTQGGMAITRISLATTSVRKDKDGNQQERTEWHRVVFFGKLGEIAGEYLRKGSSVYVEGSLRYDKYTGQDGVEKYSTDIIADEMQMLGGRGEGGPDADGPCLQVAAHGRGDEREGARDEQGPGRPLRPASHDEHERVDRGGDRDGRDAEGDEADPHHQHPSVGVGQGAGEQDQRAEGDEVGVDDPLLRGDPAAELFTDGGKGDVHHSPVEERDERGQHGDRDDEPLERGEG